MFVVAPILVSIDPAGHTESLNDVGLAPAENVPAAQFTQTYIVVSPILVIIDPAG